MRPGHALVLATLALPLPAAANDSTAELAAGGLAFVRSEAVEMRSEDLSISSSEVAVRYRFFNRSDEDVVSLVAFPLPDITVAGPDDNIAVPTDNPERPIAFMTIADGKPVAVSVEQRAIAYGIDRTELLRSLGIPLAPHLPSTNDILDRLPPDKWEELIRAGIAEISEYDDDGTGMKRHLEARWTLRTTFYWEQRFPAGAETIIEHRYAPSVGQSVGTMLGQPGAAKSPELRGTIAKYCVDQPFLAAAERAAKAAAKSDRWLGEERISYVLTTGANWAGPIGAFRLVVDKGRPDNLVSFCGSGVRKIGPTQFELRKTDFVPTEDLHVLILTAPEG
jgi:hypothetical protein